MSSKEDLSASVPILVGPNWIIWEAQMKAYLCTKGLWQLVSGNKIRAENLPTGRNARAARAATAEREDQEAQATIPFPTDEQLAARAKLQMDWDNKDDQALGIITLKISHSLRTHITDEASVVWQSLSNAFATPGPAAISYDLAKVINLHIQSNRHPAANMNTMWDLFERLRAQRVDIPNNLRALILLNTMPPSLQTVVSVTLQTSTTEELNFDNIRNDVNTILNKLYEKDTLTHTSCLLLSARGTISNTTSKGARSSSLQINLIAPNRGARKTRNKRLRNTGNVVLVKIEAEVEGVLGVVNPMSTIMTIRTSDSPRSRPLILRGMWDTRRNFLLSHHDL